MALKNLFDNYKEFEEIINSEKDGELDLKDVELNPTIMLPLICECKNKNLHIVYGENSADYLENKLKNNILFSKLPQSRKESDECDFLTNYVENLD